MVHQQQLSVYRYKGFQMRILLALSLLLMACTEPCLEYGYTVQPKVTSAGVKLVPVQVCVKPGVAFEKADSQ